MRIQEQDRQQRLARFMANVTAFVDIPKPRSDRPMARISQEALKLLISANDHPATMKLDHYAQNDIHVAHGRRAIEELLAKKMIRTVALVREGRGARPEVIQLLEAGKAELSERGIEIVKQVVTRGSWEHDVYCRIIGKLLARDGFKVSFERWFGNKAFDVLGEKDGEFIGYEAVCSGSSEWNARQGLRGATVPGLSRVVVACKSREAMGQIQKVLKADDELGIFQGKIEVRFLGEFVSAVLGAALVSEQEVEA